MMAPPKVLIAARNLLGLKQVEAAEIAGISRRTIQRLELGELDRTHASILLQCSYEDQGIVFVRPWDGQGWGLIDNSQATSSGLQKPVGGL
jgi:DNA-binding XRE family transcriptional regulator